MRKGRFTQPASELAQAFSESVSFDHRLYRHDIAGSVAHAEALAAAGIITDDEFELIRQDDIPEWPFDAFWDHFWSSAICSYTECEPQLRASSMTTSDFYSDRQWRSTGMYSEVLHPAGLEYELVVPMPAEAGVARRMLFARKYRRPFTSDECQIAQLLRPHIIEAIRYYERRQALAALTHRQRTIVMLLALGFDNTTIARRLGVSAGTVRVHLENIFERLDVNSRSEAVAKAHPDLVWC